MRVAHVIDCLQIGGAEKLLVTFADAAHARGIATTVVSLSNPNNTPIPNQLAALGARVVNLPATRLLDARRMVNLVQLLRRERYDVLNTHLTYANIIGAFAGRLAHIPVVSTLHSAGSDPAHHRLIPRLESVALRYGARRVIAVGKVVAHANQARLGKRTIDVIPNAVAVPPCINAPERFAIRKELTEDASRPLLISVGRLNRLKGYADLLDAFALVRQKHARAFLAIAGGGDLYDDLAARINALGLQGASALLGSRDDVPRLLAASDLYVSASHLEGLPVSVLEAMAAGLPVVATDVGDVAQVVVEGAGVIVPARQPELLATAVNALLDNPAQMQMFGALARTYVLANYSQTIWMDRLLALYSEVKR